MAELRNIADSSETGQIVLIEDSTEASGRLLLQYCAHASSARSAHLHVASHDLPPQAWRKQLPSTNTARLHVYDGYSDPLGWTSRQPLCCADGLEGTVLRCDSASELETTLLSSIEPCSGRSVVVIDSLSALLRYHSVAWCCQLLKKLARLEQPSAGGDAGANGGVRVLVLVHSDLHSDTTMALLHHVANTIVSLTEAPSSTGQQVKKFSAKIAAQDTALMCELLHRRTSGKITKETSLVAVSASTFQLHSAVFSAEEELQALQASSSSAPDPTANLTFNLRLTNQEKEARSNVVLPYTQVRSKRDRSVTAGPASGQLSAAGGGQIFYQPDDADDFDEEDPDDDLDI